MQCVYDTGQEDFSVGYYNLPEHHYNLLLSVTDIGEVKCLCKNDIDR